MAGHADLAAAGLGQHHLIEVGPLLDRGIEPGIQCCGPGERGTHESWLMHTPVLARLKGLGCRGAWSWIPFSQRRDNVLAVLKMLDIPRV